MNFFQTIENTARRGAEGLMPDARQALIHVIQQACGPDGGHSDLTGKQSDPYYSFFAWLSLRALMGHAPASLEAYFARCPANNPVDLFCTAFVRIQRLPALPRSFATLSFLLRHRPKDPYSLFLSGLLLGLSFPRLTPLLLRLAQPSGTTALSTSRLAAQLLANPYSSHAPVIRKTLLGRRSRTGGFASAEEAPPDLLATAVARIALADEVLDSAQDLLFIEACWVPEGLFGPSPGVSMGDVEHTYYALLALGTCRAPDVQPPCYQGK
jgi:Prenyltransferase and squalene oxidase repeat